jgi:hypothetical protein
LVGQNLYVAFLRLDQPFNFLHADLARHNQWMPFEVVNFEQINPENLQIPFCVIRWKGPSQFGKPTNKKNIGVMPSNARTWSGPQPVGNPALFNAKWRPHGSIYPICSLLRSLWIYWLISEFIGRVLKIRSGRLWPTTLQFRRHELSPNLGDERGQAAAA